MATRHHEGAMTVTPAATPFRFETEYEMSEVARARPPRRETKLGLTEDQIFMAFGVIGAALLFWKFTISLGAGILAMGTFLWAMRERSRTMRKRYAALREPAGRVRVGATESAYWIRGDEFSAESTWNRVINALELNDMLLVQSWTMPGVYFPVAELREAGVYDNIRALVDERSAVYRAQREEARSAPA